MQLIELKTQVLAIPGITADRATVATQIAYAVFAPIAWGILWFCCLTFHAWQALAEWWHSAPIAPTGPIADEIKAICQELTIDKPAKPRQRRTAKATA
jgi:hypothetical protein